jgi:Icc-related predicted phosphoesterase
VQEAIDEALKLEGALARLRTQRRIALLHYSPIQATVQGEPAEIFAYLGTSRLEEPLNRHPVDLVFHGHAHHGALEGRTAAGTPVYNVAMPLLLQRFPGRPPFRVVEIPAAPPSETAAAIAHLAEGRRTALAADGGASDS